MKPIAAKILENLNENSLFLVKEVKRPFFSTEFHFHHECQLVYIVKSEGNRVIGDNIEHFESNELVFMGSNLPHVWHNDLQYFNEDKNLYAHSLALYFKPDELLNQLSAFGNTKKISTFLNTAQQGIKFSGKSKDEIVRLLFKMLHQKGLDLTITFFRVINLLSSTKQYQLLASSGYINNYHPSDNERIDRVFKYVFDNFKEEIPLTTIAGVAGMNVQAFCRYFKTRTQKSFTEFVNEIRIGHACKLLSNPQETIIQIAFESGFNTISNFNRFFKAIKGMTPRDYRKQISI